uniref:Uncharacterized protein n=1 Tax=Pararge aegeria TaxID=116150 RepID=S4PR45_9NEOP
MKALKRSKIVSVQNDVIIYLDMLLSMTKRCIVVREALLRYLSGAMSACRYNERLEPASLDAVVSMFYIECYRSTQISI